MLLPQYGCSAEYGLYNAMIQDKELPQSASSSFPRMSSVDASLVLRAVQSRLPEKNRTSSKAPRVTTAYEYEPFQDNHQQRMGFRRLINPGIIRNNPDKLASKALQVSSLNYRSLFEPA